jgi:hypothetical protein
LIISVREHYQGIAGQARNDGRQQAEEKAEAEYDEFNKTQKILSDFDKHLRELGNDGSNN